MYAVRCSSIRSMLAKCSMPRSFATEISVRQLPYSVTAETVSTLLAERGAAAPSNINIVVTGSGRPTGRAYVTYEADADAEKAIAVLLQEPFDGRTLKTHRRGPQTTSPTEVPIIPFGGNEEDVFTKVRKALLADTDRSVDDERLQQLLRSQIKIEDFDDDLAKSVAKVSAATRVKIATIGNDANDQGSSEEAAEQTAAMRQAEEEEALLEAARLAKAAPDPTSGGSAVATDDLPGQWVETIVDVARVQKIIKGGSIMSYRVLAVVGNANGAGGFGVGKALTPQIATTRAIRDAKKRLIIVDRFKNTSLVHSVEGRHNSCRVVLRAVPPGYGQKGGNIAKAILTQMGIADCTAKAHGRRTPFAVVRAMFKALARHQSLEDISRARGRRVIELEWRRGI